MSTIKNDYDFGGWYLDSALSKPFDSKNPITKNLILYAKWNCKEYEDAFEYEDYDDGVKITSLNSTYYNKKSIKIPSQLGGKNVVRIEGIFCYNCDKLEAVELPETLKEIGSSAFMATPIKNITIPNSVTYIDDCSFMYCKELEKVTLSNSLTNISQSLFYGCSSLTEITIPSSVKLIGSCAFQSCTSLETVVNNSVCTSLPADLFNGCTKLKNVNIPGSVISIDYSAFYNTDISASSLVFDDMISKWINYDTSEEFSSADEIIDALQNGTKISKKEFEIPDYSNFKFMYKGNYEVAIKNSDNPSISGNKLSIPSKVFYESEQLGRIELKVTEIANEGFKNVVNNCNNVTEIEIPSTVRSIGSNAFEYDGTDECTLTTINFDGDTQEISIIKGSAFKNTSLSTILINGNPGNKLPESLLEMEGCVFQNTKISEITLPASLSIIKNSEYASETAFYSMDELINIFVDSENKYFKSIDGVLFSRSGESCPDLLIYPAKKDASDYVIPEGTTKIAAYAFQQKRLGKITFPSSFETADSLAFVYYDDNEIEHKCKFDEIVILSESIAKGSYYDLNYTYGMLNPIENSAYILIPNTISLGDESYIKNNFSDAARTETGYNIYYKASIECTYYSMDDSGNTYLKSSETDFASGEMYTISIISDFAMNRFYILDANQNKVDLPNKDDIEISVSGSKYTNFTVNNNEIIISDASIYGGAEIKLTLSSGCKNGTAVAEFRQ